MRVLAQRLEYVNIADRADKSYTGYLLEGPGTDWTLRFGYGPRAATGTLTRPGQYADAYAAQAAMDEQFWTKTEYRQVTPRLEFTVPDDTDPAAPAKSLAPLLREAFTQAWRTHWGPAQQWLDQAAARGGEPALLVVPCWDSQVAAWPVLDRLAALLTGAVRVDGTDPRNRHPLTMFVTTGPVASWVREHYAVPGRHFLPVTSLPAAPGDDAAVLASALALWQPHAAGPLAELTGALDAARLMFAR